ncbi:hypothetical protein KDA23_03850 [Candidatus Saccharibacteria bacterium]|nr:hypothetical protein [Candidatus Saccharibacteria bacterium]
MNRLTFDDYAYHARGTALFLDLETHEQFDIVHTGFNEEVGELLTDQDYPVELTSKLWGLETDEVISEWLNKSKSSEAGDVLYYIAAASALRGIPLRDIASEAIERYTGESALLWDETIIGLDSALTEQMARAVPDGYRPNYLTWKMWDFAPFENGLHILMREPVYAKGPLRLIPDGRYALERLHSTFGRLMSPEASSDDEFVVAGALTLGGLSIVLQNRFGSSLHQAAANNIVKRERRHALDQLREGSDAERSRELGKPRQVISDDEGTNNNLLNAPLPEV